MEIDTIQLFSVGFAIFSIWFLMMAVGAIMVAFRRSVFPVMSLVSGLLISVLWVGALPNGVFRPADHWTHAVTGYGLTDNEEYSVLAVHFDINDAIYVTFGGGDLAGVRGIVFPWDSETAQALQDALDEAERNGTGVQMRWQFEPSLDNRDPLFYAIPQPVLPNKPFEEDPVLRFEGQGQDA